MALPFGMDRTCHHFMGTSGEGWPPPCSLWWPCGPETCFFFGCLVCYIFWLEVPKMELGLGHSLADWCFYNMMPECECVFHGTRTCGRIWKTEVCGVGVGGLSLVEEAELGIISMSGLCCLYQLCLLLLWEGMHLFILRKSLRVLSKGLEEKQKTVVCSLEQKRTNRIGSIGFAIQGHKRFIPS